MSGPADLTHSMTAARLLVQVKSGVLILMKGIQSDCVDLFRSVSNHMNRHVHKAALDQEGSWVARRNAVYKLTDQSLLAKIAQNDPEWNVRTAAVWMLTDQSLLAHIAQNDSNPNVRQAARIKFGLQKNCAIEANSN